MGKIRKLHKLILTKVKGVFDGGEFLTDFKQSFSCEGRGFIINNYIKERKLCKIFQSVIHFEKLTIRNSRILIKLNKFTNTCYLNRILILLRISCLKF